ncbi:ATP-binding protein [Cyanobacteria bacterium FACHB-472]|nr:ATP-binding protein [Cyanobacteria bacterium FACHB-472]
MSRGISRLRLYSFGFSAAICLVRRNQKVDVIVLVDLGWVHPLVLPHLPFFLNCVTPELVEIASEHLNREEALLYQANRYLFTDTNAITTYMFSLYYHNTAAPRLAKLAKRAASRYDIVFVCDVDIPYDDTWDRSGDVNRSIFQKQIVNDLIIRKIPFFLVQGELETRVKYVKSVLEKYRKYENLLDLFVER